VPPPEIRLRELTRLRKAQINERARAIQRLEKVLQAVGIKLTSVASAAYSVSARAMLEALLAGTTDPNELAELARGSLRGKIPQLREALANRFELAHHGVLVSGLLAHIDALDQGIAALDARVVEATEPFAELVELVSTIPGVKQRNAQVLIAECGTDMSVFPTVHHFASWARICPGNNQSAGKHRSGKTLRGSRWLRQALTESARAAARTKGTYLASHYWQIRGRRGEPKAIGAIRHDILVAYYHIARDRVPFRELGPTGSPAATRPSTGHTDSCANSRRSASKSHSKPPPKEPNNRSTQPRSDPRPTRWRLTSRATTRRDSHLREMACSETPSAQAW
jgi:transposase